MTPRQMAREVENAYDGRDREHFARFVERLVVAAERPLTSIDCMCPAQLQARRNELHVQLAAVNDRLQPHIAARRALMVKPYDMGDDVMEASD